MHLIEFTPAQRSELAAKGGTDPKYLYQCATGRRTMSGKLARRLIEVEPRLTMDELFAPPPEKDAEAA